MDRRSFLVRGAAAAGGAALVGACGRRDDPDAIRWDTSAFAPPGPSPVAVLKQDAYGDDLTDSVQRGCAACGLDVRGRRVVLKPNLVEFDPDGVVNTSPALVAATVEALRRMGAARVTVAEGPGHRRDNGYLLRASGLDLALRDVGADYVDLNLDDTRPVPTRSSFSDLRTLHLPRTVLDADLLVSMPKLKTHHWAGMTLSMKNMFGIMPGALYGWPKNVLHWAGIENSILDINAALTMPRFNIVDGVVGMEGNGPIQGTARRSGVLIFGADPVAVDATGARLMMLEPGRIEYLRQAGRFLGNVGDDRIPQLAEDPASLEQDYAVLDRFRGLKAASMAVAG